MDIREGLCTKNITSILHPEGRVIGIAHLCWKWSRLTGLQRGHRYRRVETGHSGDRGCKGPLFVNVGDVLKIDTGTGSILKEFPANHIGKEV